jgi:hypothetical protein
MTTNKSFLSKNVVFLGGPTFCLRLFNKLLHAINSLVRLPRLTAQSYNRISISYSSLEDVLQASILQNLVTGVEVADYPSLHTLCGRWQFFWFERIGGARRAFAIRSDLNELLQAAHLPALVVTPDRPPGPAGR